MKKQNDLINQKTIPQLFVFGMYRSGTTIIARSLAGEKKIAFASDPIRPFFNWYRTELQKKIGSNNVESYSQPLGDYFNGNKNYIKKLIVSDFSEKISISKLISIRKDIINQGGIYSPKFINSLENENVKKITSYSDELKLYLSLIRKNYGSEDTRIIGLKEVWSIEMAFPIINMIGKKAKILIVLRNPLDIIASSVSGSANYSILTLTRQWRKQIVFYNFLKNTYPDQVLSINYEDFCSSPNLTLQNKIKCFTKNSIDIFSNDISPIDDSGKPWIKNSSYFSTNLSKKIDQKSVGKYKSILNKSEIEWITYLTHMSSYKRYNQNNIIPKKPTSIFPKCSITKVANWAKSAILDLEGDNLHMELEKEYARMNMIKFIQSKNKNDVEVLLDQL